MMMDDKMQARPVQCGGAERTAQHVRVCLCRCPRWPSLLIWPHPTKFSPFRCHFSFSFTSLLLQFLMLFLRFCCCVRFSLSVQCQLMGNHLSCACLLGERVKENIHCIFEAKQKVPELNDNYPRHRTETRPRRTESSIIYHL